MATLDFIHVGITVKDLDVTRRFYEKLGFTVSKEPFATTWEGYWKAKNFFYKLPEGTNGKILFMASPSGAKVEFFWFDQLVDGEYDVWNRPGIHHIALSTDDIKSVVEALRAEGVEFELGPVKGTTQEFVFLRDPDGNMIEIGQPYDL
ncbi:MAG: VOC family protein [Christensenellales bacterium]|jgi:catechol 2,3-dioxygenase-like lactoylglutathione lyase family enzyme